MDLFIKNNFKKDKSGKSDAYFLKKKINLDQIFFKKFLKFAKRDKKTLGFVVIRILIANFII